jgi:hypothetical protein
MIQGNYKMAHIKFLPFDRSLRLHMDDDGHALSRGSLFPLRHRPSIEFPEKFNLPFIH